MLGEFKNDEEFQDKLAAAMAEWKEEGSEATEKDDSEESETDNSEAPNFSKKAK